MTLHRNIAVAVIFAALIGVPAVLSAQTAPPRPEPPAFLKGLDSADDYDRLTEEQRKELEAYRRKIGPPPVISETVIPEGTVDCFQYYKFGSVRVSISPSVPQTVPGVAASFSGTITNDNSYPVIGGTVYAKVFRKTGDGTETHQNGYPLVDQFVVKEGVALPANGSEPIGFSWDIPRYAISGDYEVAMFFYTADRFNLLGLTFTDDIVGDRAQFTVTSDVVGSVAFDKNAVTMNGRQFRFAAYPLHFRMDEPVRTEVKLINTTASRKEAALTWRLYNWDALRESNLLDEKQETVALAAGETKSLSYETVKYSGAVSFLVIESEVDGVKSILDTRFIRDGVAETRINFPSITDFPLRRGEGNAIFACAHSTNLPVVPNSEIELTLKDQNGGVIHSYTYEGGISGAMMGIKDDFVPKATYDRFTLSTVLKRDGKVIEALDLNYDCERIDPSLCSAPVAAQTQGRERGGLALAIPVGLIVLAILLGVLAWSLMRKGSNGPRMLSLFAAVLLAGTLCSIPAPAGAAKTSVATIVPDFPDDERTDMPDALYHFYNEDVTGDGIIDYEAWFGALMDYPIINVGYNARLLDTSTGLEIPDGANILPGTVIRIDTPQTVTDIAWAGTGFAGDSPYGHFAETAVYPGADQVCTEDNFVTSLFYGDDPTIYDAILYGGASNDIFIPLMVTIPDKVYTLTGTATYTELLPAVDGDPRYRIDSAGTLNISIKNNSTIGRFYFGWTYEGAGGCSWTETRALRSNTAYEGIYYDCWVMEGGIPLAGCPGLADVGYNLAVPAVTIPFSLTVGTLVGSAPTAPVVTGPTAGETAIPYTFSATSTDADGDTIRYGFDWNADGAVDRYVPANDIVTGLPVYVASGITQSADYSWITIGTKTLQVLAEDSNGLRSAFTPHTIVISTPPAGISQLEICVDGAHVNLGSSRSLLVGTSENLRAYYDDTPTDCAGTEVTSDPAWSWTASSPAVTISGTAPRTVTGSSAGSAIVSVANATIPASGTLNYTVIASATCFPDCSTSDNFCSGTTYPDGCGSVCSGTKPCDFNWREVAP